MKKSAGVIEFALLLAFVAIISIATMSIYNNCKINLTNMSKVTVKE